MTTKIIGGGEITRPSTTPISSSILDHATVKDVSDGMGWTNDEGLWVSYNMLDTIVPVDICVETPTDTDALGLASWVPGLLFALQGGARCKAVGLDTADQKAEVERVFALNEGKGIEATLLAHRFVADANPDHTPDWWPAPTDITHAGMSLVQALAVLEGYAAANYAGVPTLHMPRAAASLLGANHIVWEGGKAFTRFGSKVAIGGGYDAAGAPDGTWDLYATGEVYVERSEQMSFSTAVLPGNEEEGSDANPALLGNTVFALAERMYRVAVDGFVAKATATVWA